MTNPGKSAAPVQWAGWCPDRLTNRTKIHPRYVKVPSDQQELLDRPDAWSSGGFPNVPSRVLEDAIREGRLRTDVAREAPSSQPGSPSQHLRAALSSQAPSPAHGGKEVLSSQPVSPARSIVADDKSSRVTPEAEGDSGGEGDKDTGTPIPWTSSPSAHFRSPGHSRDQTGTARPSSRPAPEPQSVPSTRKPPSRAAFLADFPPSSSIASETGLEVEVPRAITDALEPVNRKPVAAAMGPTPPSAQVIPCTLTEKTSPPQVPAEKPKRRGRMKHPNDITTLANLGPVDQRNSSRPKILDPRAGSSSPVITSSSPASRTPPRQLPKRSPVVPSTAAEHSPAPAQQLGIVAAKSQVVSNQGPSHSVNTLPRDGPASQAPFTAFRLAYPDYQGSLNDFLRGVICIWKLQEDKALSEFLYDDFVRVFAGEYLAYIGTWDRYERPLPAIQWYNENVSRPLYMRGVLTKDNVKDVASRYPKEVLAIQQNLETIKPRGRSRPSYQATSTTKERTQVAALPAISGQVLPQNGLLIATACTSPLPVARETRLCTDRRPVAAEPHVVAQDRATTAAVTSSIGIPGPSPAPRSRAKIGASSAADTPASRPMSFRTQIDSSLPDISHTPTPRVTHTKAPAASAFANLAPSQLSNPDSIPETTRKRKVTPRASTGSSAGAPGAEFKRPRLTKEEKRDLEFRKFLMRKKMQSSAPQGSAAS